MLSHMARHCSHGHTSGHNSIGKAVRVRTMKSVHAPVVFTRQSNERAV